jgi:hypothetical protein
MSNDGTGRGLTEVLSLYKPGGTEEYTITSVRMEGVSAEIRNG